MDEARVKLLYCDAKVPKRSNCGDAGLDLYSVESLVLTPKMRCLISTGIAMSIPCGIYGKIEGRSGLASKYGIDVMAGVIDSNYRGEIKVLLINHGEEDFKIEVGDRIAQIIFSKYHYLDLVASETLDDTSRGVKGFGSSGMK